MGVVINDIMMYGFRGNIKEVEDFVDRNKSFIQALEVVSVDFKGIIPTDEYFKEALEDGVYVTSIDLYNDNSKKIAVNEHCFGIFTDGMNDEDMQSFAGFVIKIDKHCNNLFQESENLFKELFPNETASLFTTEFAH